MDISSIVCGLVGGAIAVALLTRVSRRVGRAAGPGQLRFGPFMWIIGALSLCMALVPVVATVLGNDEDFWIKAVLFISFGACAFYCFAEAAFVKGHYDSERISLSTPWTGAKSEAWSDIQSVALNRSAGWYALTFRSGNKIRLSCYLGGHMSAVDMAEAARQPSPTRLGSGR